MCKKKENEPVAGRCGEKKRAIHLRLGGEDVVVGVELAGGGVEPGDSDVAADHQRAALGAAEAERRVLALVHLGRQPDDDAVHHGVPLHLHATVQQLPPRQTRTTTTKRRRAMRNTITQCLKRLFIYWALNWILLRMCVYATTWFLVTVRRI